MRDRCSRRGMFAALGLLAAGCSSVVAPSGIPVNLATYEGDGLSCYTNAQPYFLIPDPSVGTAMLATGETGRVGGSPIPLA